MVGMEAIVWGMTIMLWVMVVKAYQKWNPFKD